VNAAPGPASAAPPEFAPILDFLRRTGLAGGDETPPAVPLAGGVSSDIWKVELARGRMCVKRALPRLRVAQLWEAPVSRNRYERLWLETANALMPGAAPRVLAGDDSGFFAMEYLDPSGHPLWKAELAAGRADAAFAAATGAALARIHASTAGDAHIAARFATDAAFHAIRLEPYLIATGRAHPALASRLQVLADTTAAHRLALVHGDVSPKNILLRPGPNGTAATPVFLDAECAWYGDPAFDLAFCLNHLLLKCLWVPAAASGFLASFEAFSRAYLAGADWEPRAGLEARTAALLPGLLLARVDGKSPVEYLTAEAQRACVRRAAHPLLQAPTGSLAALSEHWHKELRA
jgi:aminoglycoside phosphotransferase (APT) family kinase protein